MKSNEEMQTFEIESSNQKDKGDDDCTKDCMDKISTYSSRITRKSRNKSHRRVQKEAFKVIQILFIMILLGNVVQYIVHGRWISIKFKPDSIQTTTDTAQDIKKGPPITFLDQDEKWTKSNGEITKKSRMIPGIKQSQYDQQEQMDEDGDCIAQYDWQLESYPTCNLLHEYDMTKFSLSKSMITENNADDELVLKLINHGYFRDVWRHKTPKPAMKAHEQVDNDDELFDMVAIKTLRYEHEFLPIYYERNRRDAMASEHLTKYNSIMDIYGYCGQSALFEYADGGTLEQTVWNSNEPFTLKEKLIIAYQVAQAFYAVHNVDKVGTASIAHADAMAKQFLYVSKDQRFKLNDFNSAEFITWNKKTNEPCPYEVTTRGGRYKSPEEYKDDYVTEKADMYSVGNIFYLLLTSAAPFYEELDDNIVIERIKNGESPTLDWLPDDFLMPLYRAIDRCWNHDPQQRISPFELKQHFEIYFRIVGISLKQDKVRFHKIPQDLLDADYHKE